MSKGEHWARLGTKGTEGCYRAGANSPAMGPAMNVINSLSRKVNNFLCVTVEGNPVPTDADLWGMSLGAMYDAVNGVRIVGFSPTGFLIGRSKLILKDFWGIDGNTREGKHGGAEATSMAYFLLKLWLFIPSIEFNKAAKHDQVISVLDWLIHEGHRAAPQYVAGNPEAAQDMLAWDLARTVMVARLALRAGYVSDFESLSYVRAAAVKAQQGFSSWEGYGQHYLKGLTRWAGRPIGAYEKAVDFLLKNPRSPWRHLDWRAPLTHAEFKNVEKGPLGTLVYLRRSQAGRLFAGVAGTAMVLTILGGIILKDKTSGPPSIHKATVAKTAQQEFDELKINFVASDSKIIAVLATTSETHPITDFRYGVDSILPNKTMGAEQRENGRFPTAIYLPKETRFVTVGVRYDDGSPSWTRRFEVPSHLRRAN